MIASPPVPQPTVPPPKRTTPLKRNMIAWRRRFRCWALKSPARLCLRGAGQGSPGGERRGRPGATPDGLSRDCRLPTCSGSVAKTLEAARRTTFSRTTHVGPNQTAGPTAWPNRFYANFVAKPRAWTPRRDLAREPPAEANARSSRGALARHIVALVHAMSLSYGRDRSPR